MEIYEKINYLIEEKKMTKKETIKDFLNGLTKADLYDLVQHFCLNEISEIYSGLDDDGFLEEIDNYYGGIEDVQ